MLLGIENNGTVTKFAWFPKRVRLTDNAGSNWCTIWLENYCYEVARAPHGERIYGKPYRQTRTRLDS
jgi:hypothetical protein